MKFYEYRVVPAPKKGEKSKGAKTTADRFAIALTGVMNKMGADGWDYIRSDTLPCDERVGLTGSKTVFQNMLVFRRETRAEAVDMLMPTPSVERPVEQAAQDRPAAPPLRREPKLSPIPAELFADPEPSEVEPIDVLPKRDIPAAHKAD